MKGTGKTALLRYISLKANEMNATSSFILFKSDITEEDRKIFSHAANAITIDSANIPDNQDFVDVWFWFIHRHIVNTINKCKVPVFKKNKEWNQYKACVLATSLDDEYSFFSRFFPKLKRGVAKVDAQFPIISANLGLDFEFSDSKKTHVKFNHLVTKANDLFTKLTPDTGKLYILLDELELSLITTKLYKRDARIIRDAIISIEKLNTISKSKGFGICLIGAIRSEVLTAVASLGKEINKPTSDFGIPIYWHQSGGDISTHPILKILIKRINSSELCHDAQMQSSDNEIWDSYFPKYVQETPTPTYILHQTWYRPRDVIRLLTLAQKHYPTKTSFDHQVFDAIRKQYSTESWTELSEELKALFNDNEMEGIKRLFYGFKANFSYAEISIRAKKNRTMYGELDALLDKHQLPFILSKLYKIGFIGNVSDARRKSHYRFSHRGDDEILMDKDFTIHRGLRSYLSIY